MAKFLNQWDYQYYGTSASTTTSGNWYQYHNGQWNQHEMERYYREQREIEAHRRRMDQMMPPPAYQIDEREISRLALGPAPKKEETPLDWLHKRVNEVCDDALTAVV